MIAACFAAALVLFFSGGLRLIDVAFVLGAVGACLVLAIQSSANLSSMPALTSVIICLGERARRSVELRDAGARNLWPGRTAHLSILGLLAVSAAEPLAVNSYALLDYAGHTRGGLRLPQNQLRTPLSGFVVSSPDAPSLHEFLGHDDTGHKKLVDRRRSLGGSELDAAGYLSTIAEGLEFMRGRVAVDDAIVVFDMTDPLTAPLGLRPTSYGFPLFWAGGGFTRMLHPPPEQFFSNATYALVPVVPYSQRQLDLMMEIYGQYLAAHFQYVESSGHWDLWRKRGL